jgi:hypothetical protein
MLMYTIYHSKGRTEIFIMNKIPFAQQINHSKCKNKDVDETVDLFCFCNFNRFEFGLLEYTNEVDLNCHRD